MNTLTILTALENINIDLGFFILLFKVIAVFGIALIGCVLLSVIYNIALKTYVKSMIERF